MENSQQRHEISDKVWELLSPLLPGQAGQWGGVEDDNSLRHLMFRKENYFFKHICFIMIIAKFSTIKPPTFKKVSGF